MDSPQQLSLLRRTLQDAYENSPYYQQTLAGHDLDLAALSGLTRLPLLTRRDYAIHSFQIVRKGAAPAFVNLTGGTSSQRDPATPPLFHFHGAHERSAYGALLGHGSAPSTVKPLILTLVSGQHGVPISAGMPGVVHLPLENDVHFRALTEALQREWPFPGFAARINTIGGTLNLVKLLTLLCSDAAVDMQELQVQTVVTGGWHLSNTWKERLGMAWAAEIAEVYGLSEVPGLHAQRCPLCGSFHFSPLTILEVLNLHEDAPSKDREGRLVVTALYPLAHTQPLIRYDTGDVVEQRGICEATGLTSVEVLGRRRDVIASSSSGGVLLAPLHLARVADSLGVVAESANSRSKAFELDDSFGFPLISAENGADGEGSQRITIRCRPAWGESGQPDRDAALRAQILAGLKRESPRLRSELAGGMVRLEVSLSGAVEPLRF